VWGQGRAAVSHLHPAPTPILKCSAPAYPCPCPHPHPHPHPDSHPPTPTPTHPHPKGYPIGKGADLFISVWNLHRSPHLWKDPDTFRPERFEEVFTNPAFGDKWAGAAGRAAAGGRSRLALSPRAGAPRRERASSCALHAQTHLLFPR
jgi:hypothetical protein